MSRALALRFGSGVLLIAALSFFGRGAWIYAKASLSQILLRRAWARTVHGGKEVRPWPWADTWPIARLRAPAARQDFIVLAGASGRTLAFGPGHLDWTARPGRPGNCVLSAHRDTQFAFLRRLETGDPLELETPDGRRHVYRVFDRRVAHKRQTGILEDTSEPTLTLVTCYPFDAVAPGGPLRYVVRAREVPPAPRAAAYRASSTATAGEGRDMRRADPPQTAAPTNRSPMLLSPKVSADGCRGGG